MTKSKVLSFIADTVETVLMSLAIFLVIYIFVAQPHQVNGHSMDPTLQTGEYLLTEKLSYRFSEVKRGDIIVFHAPKVACSAGDCDYIKRVIGLPGETVQIVNGQFLINGAVLAEEAYLPVGVSTNPGFYTNDEQIVTLGENEYFVSGDNRPGSSDSRIWGPIDKKSIVGKAVFSYWPMQTFGAIEQGVY
jgi:signal peptidase I